jgi:hypothetical protein
MIDSGSCRAPSLSRISGVATLAQGAPVIIRQDVLHL